jgi:hypothetical protein
MRILDSAAALPFQRAEHRHFLKSKPAAVLVEDFDRR